MKGTILEPAGILAISLFALFLGPGSGRSEEDAFSKCRQIVLVSSTAWESPAGKLDLWQKEDGKWRAVRSGISVTVGRNGMGVGVGLHRDSEEEPKKKEGDKRAPAGIFPLEFGFGRKARPMAVDTLPFRRAGASDLWVDDPGSNYYNQWVNLSDRSIRKDWNSAEILARRDGLYDLVIVVGHNRSATVPGRGSAIFIHRWRAEGVPTVGCTAMDAEELLQLWKWLKKEHEPLLIQGPAPFLKTLNLPETIQSSL